MNVQQSPVLGPNVSRRAVLGGSLALGASGLLLPAYAQAAPAVLSPSAEKAWPKVAALMHKYADARTLPGIVATVGRGDDPFQTLAIGATTFGGRAAVSADSLYRVYSMTKPVTGLLTAILIDQGRLSLDTRLADICPEFANMAVAIDPTKGLEARPAVTQITVRHLLTHTAGFGYAVIGQEKVSAELLRRGLVAGAITRRKFKGLTPEVPVPAPDAFLQQAAEVPLVAEPGTVWRYSMGVDVLGLALARKEGRPLEQLMQEHIFGPAGMVSTWFQMPAAEAKRLTTNYGFLKGFHAAIDKPRDSVFLDVPPFAAGGAGLVSSPRDFDRFQRLLVSDGRIDGKQVISAAAVRLATSNLLPPEVKTAGTTVAGAGFGAGGRVGLGVDEGSFGWSGAAGTIFIVQRRVALRGALYAQFMPSSAFPLQREFLAALRADVMPKAPL